MCWKVWFIPAQPNHVAKFMPLKEAMRQRGCEIHTLCVDIAIPPRKSIRTMLDATGEPFEMLPPCGFRPFGRWPFELVQRGRLNRAVQQWLDSHEVDLLVFGTDTPIVTREFIKEAQKRHIPRVHLHDGLCVEPNPQLRPGLLTHAHYAASDWLTKVFDMRPPRYERSADLFFVMDESSPAALLRQGDPPDRIKVVGSAQYDALARQVEKGASDEDLSRWRETIHAPPGRPLLFYAHQHITRNREVKDLIRTLVAAMRRCGGAVYVKFHPSTGGSLDDWRRWAAGEGMTPTEVLFGMKELLSIEAVQLCGVCVTAYSTVSLEAMLCKKPLILVQYLKVPVMLRYGQKYGVPEAFSPKQLEGQIVAIMTDPAARQQAVQNGSTCVAKELHGLDGKCTDRTADEIMNLVRRYKAG